MKNMQRLLADRRYREENKRKKEHTYLHLKRMLIRIVVKVLLFSSSAKMSSVYVCIAAAIDRGGRFIAFLRKIKRFNP